MVLIDFVLTFGFNGRKRKPKLMNTRLPDATSVLMSHVR